MTKRIYTFRRDFETGIKIYARVRAASRDAALQELIDYNSIWADQDNVYLNAKIPEGQNVRLTEIGIHKGPGRIRDA